MRATALSILVEKHKKKKVLRSIESTLFPIKARLQPIYVWEKYST